MEEATGAPSSLAVCYPKRLRASARDKETVMTEALSAVTMLVSRHTRRREFIALLGGALSAFHCVSASAQEGYYGAGHDKWHQGFSSTLKRNDGQGSCCNLMDCRPTQSRMVGDHYEVKGDGEWIRVPRATINNSLPPHSGALLS